MNFSAALTAAQAGKTISRPSLPGQSFIWVTSASVATGVSAAVKPHLAMVTTSGGLVERGANNADMAATDWVAA